ncbi:MAG: sulfoxide reductase heme-binding subunit YedZ [Deltaproteobacteria bacterium]|nr:sulfoxide reductase heme-binding subunit YedZ [Deltaproteobacteria bacterium]
MTRIRITAATVALGLLPLLVLVVRALRDDLGANPIEEVSHETGQWTLRLLLATLAVTPLRRLSGWSWLAPQRRTLGLLCFAWAVLHVSTWVALDLAFDFGAVVEDVLDRPYITAGFTGFVCLVPLAVTSTRAWMRRLGRRWTRLHRLVYVAAAAGVVHFLWLVKADLLEPGIYAAVLALLLAARLVRR